MSTCKGNEINCKFFQVLYSEQVRGLPGRRVFIFRCELFGLSGHYSIFLRPTSSDPAIPRTAAYVKVTAVFQQDVSSGMGTILITYSWGEDAYLAV